MVEFFEDGVDLDDLGRGRRLGRLLLALEVPQVVLDQLGDAGSGLVQHRRLLLCQSGRPSGTPTTTCKKEP